MSEMQFVAVDFFFLPVKIVDARFPILSFS